MKAMQCEDIHIKISAYMDGEMDSASARRVEHHLSQCPKCREVAADLKNVDALVRGLSKLDASPDFAGRLLETARNLHTLRADKVLHRSPFPALMQFMSHFMDLLEARRSPSTRTLDEFGDCPPFSLGSIYFNLMDQPGRG